MPYLDVGDGSSGAADLVQFAVRPGDTVTVSCLSASSSAANVFQNGTDQPATSVAAGSNVAISTPGPFWVQAASGIASIEVTGGLYGNV